MNLTVVTDVVIGLAALYWLLSSGASLLLEGLHSFFNLRARALQFFVVELVYGSNAVAALVEPVEAPAEGGRAGGGTGSVVRLESPAAAGAKQAGGLDRQWQHVAELHPRRPVCQGSGRSSAGAGTGRTRRCGDGACGASPSRCSRSSGAGVAPVDRRGQPRPGSPVQGHPELVRPDDGPRHRLVQALVGAVAQCDRLGGSHRLQCRLAVHRAPPGQRRRHPRGRCRAGPAGGGECAASRPSWYRS